MTIVLTIIIERFAFQLGRYRVNSKEFFAQIKKLVAAGNIDRAIKLCDASDYPILQLVKAGLTHSNKGPDEIDAALSEKLSELKPQAEKRVGAQLVEALSHFDIPAQVVQRLAIHRHFDGIFDIVAADLEPKPQPQTYERFLAAHAVDPTRAAMFEDLPRNLKVPHALGMTTVLVLPSGTRSVFRQDWELEGQDAPHVDHVTDDLTGFLRRVVEQLAPAGERPTA